MVDVRELTFKGEDKTVLFACGKCGKLHSPAIFAVKADLANEAALELATECCKVRVCSHCGDEPLHPAWTACKHCSTRLRLERATEVPDYDGPISADGIRGEWDEGYSSEISAMLEACERDGDDVPSFAWVCNSIPMRIDPDVALESACDNQHDDADREIVDADGLVAFLNEWNAKQTCVSYFPDYSRYVVIDRERFAADVMTPRERVDPADSEREA